MTEQTDSPTTEETKTKKTSVKELRSQIADLEQLIEDRDQEASTLGARLKKAATQLTSLENDVAERDATIDTLEKTGPNIYERMLAIMEEVKYLKKDFNKNLGHPATTHDDVSEAIRKAAVNHKVFIHTTTIENSTELIPRPSKYDSDRRVSYTNVDILVTFINVDDPDDNCSCRFIGAGEGADNKTPGAAYSFAVKTALLKTFLIPTGEEEEEAHLEKSMTDEEKSASEAKKAAVLQEKQAKELKQRIAKSDTMLKDLVSQRGFHLVDTVTWIEQMHEKKWVDMDLNERQRAFKHVRSDYKGTADAKPENEEEAQSEMEGHYEGEQQGWQDQG
jgi:translation initiation factor 2B subunit (eIF-2B alpha/beta/delta family)